MLKIQGEASMSGQAKEVQQVAANTVCMEVLMNGIFSRRSNVSRFRMYKGSIHVITQKQVTDREQFTLKCELFEYFKT